MNYRFTLSGHLTGGPVTLPPAEEPIGWYDFEITLRRHDVFHGIFPEVSTKLQFFCTGYQYITDSYYLYGLDGEVYINIEFRSSPQDAYRQMFYGQIDFSDLEITEQYVSCSIKNASCIDTFLNRTNNPVNLYDEACYTELTFDQTAVRTRYLYAPYPVLFKEKTILGVSSFQIDPDALAASAGLGILTDSVFKFDGGALCTLFVCDDTGLLPPCGYSTSCDTPNGEVKLTNSPLVISLVDDLQGINNQPSATFYYPDQGVETRDCGYNQVGTNTPFDFDKWYQFKANCACSEFTITLEVSAVVTPYVLNVNSGSVEYIRVTPKLILKWGNNQLTLVSTTPTTYDNGCVPFDSTNGGGGGGTHSLGSDIVLYYNDTITVQGCDVGQNDKLSVIVQTDVGGIFNSGAGGGQSQLFQNVTFYTMNGQIISKDCIPNATRVGDTQPYTIAVHEALTRVAEYYTNNCLRVKTAYFGRPNSLAGADDYNFQNPQECYGYSGYFPIDYPPCLTGQTFDPTPFQTGANPLNVATNAGCGAWMVLSSGVQLRQFGTHLFINFDDLFGGLDAIHNIGVGWSDADPNVLRVENKEYFYDKSSVTLVLDQINLKNSGYIRRVAFENYYNKFVTGYTSSVTDVTQTIDEFNTPREYSLPLKQAQTSLDKACQMVASGYTIEYQRRQRYTVDAEFDDSTFIVCVGRSTDPDNLDCYGQPYSMFQVEQGVDDPSARPPVGTLPPVYAPNGFIDPATVYNWRISPYFNAARWLSVLKASLWRATNPVLKFGKGEANFTCGGNEICLSGCDVGAVYDDNCNVLYDWSHNESDDVNPTFITLPRTEQLWINEIVEVDVPLTLNDYYGLRTNPYGLIILNNERFFLKELTFRINSNSKLSLLKAY